MLGYCRFFSCFCNVVFVFYSRVTLSRKYLVHKSSVDTRKSRTIYMLYLLVCQKSPVFIYSLIYIRDLHIRFITRKISLFLHFKSYFCFIQALQTFFVCERAGCQFAQKASSQCGKTKRKNFYIVQSRIFFSYYTVNAQYLLPFIETLVHLEIETVKYFQSISVFTS